MKKFIYLLLIIPLFFTSCSDDNEDNPAKFPTTHEQIATAVENTNLIVKEGGRIIEDAISSAYNLNDLIDPEQIAEQIRSIEVVESAKITPSGTGIIIKQVDGTYTNLLVVTMDDERLFMENANKPVSKDMKSVFMVNENSVLPSGDGKALILAPFHSDFNENLEQISRLLSSAGFEVDKYEDADANLSRFNGDFLNNYDVVYISTHGAANVKTRGGDKSTVLLTGEEYTTNKIESLLEVERRAIATGSHDAIKSYFAISVPWLNITTTQNFTNSWIWDMLLIFLAKNLIMALLLCQGNNRYKFKEAIHLILKMHSADL